MSWIIDALSIAMDIFSDINDIKQKKSKTTSIDSAKLTGKIIGITGKFYTKNVRHIAESSNYKHFSDEHRKNHLARIDMIDQIFDGIINVCQSKKTTSIAVEDYNNIKKININGIDLVVGEKHYDSSIYKISFVVINSPHKLLNDYKTKHYKSHSLKKARKRCLEELTRKVNKKYDTDSSSDSSSASSSDDETCAIM